MAEVATLLRVSKMIVNRLIHTGDLEANRVGRQVRIPAAAITWYLAVINTTGISPGR